MDYVKINGTAYDVIVTEVEENFNILYSDNTGRTLGIGAPLTLDPYGTFYGHKVTFMRHKDNFAEYDSLFIALSKPTYSGINVDIVHNQTTLNYQAYVSSGNRSIKRIDEKTGNVYWDKFSANFIPVKAQVTP